MMMAMVTQKGTMMIVELYYHLARPRSVATKRWMDEGGLDNETTLCGCRVDKVEYNLPNNHILILHRYPTNSRK